MLSAPTQRRTSRSTCRRPTRPASATLRWSLRSWLPYVARVASQVGERLVAGVPRPGLSLQVLLPPPLPTTQHPPLASAFHPPCPKASFWTGWHHPSLCSDTFDCHPVQGRVLGGRAVACMPLSGMKKTHFGSGQEAANAALKLLSKLLRFLTWG